MRNHNFLTLVLATALLAPCSHALADAYKVRLYDSSNSLTNTGAADYAINRTPSANTLTQGGCEMVPNAFQVTELKVVVDGVERNFVGTLDSHICRMQANKPVNYAPGTACLDQGVDLGWVAGRLSTPGTYLGNPVTYYIDFKGPTSWVNGCTASNEPQIVRQYDILRNRTKLVTNGSFAVPNIVHAVPEPGSLPLFLAGFAALALLARGRGRRASHTRTR